MKKLFLILFLGIIVASCGRNQTEIPTEIVTETPAVEEAEQTSEEVAQTEITESSQNSSTTVNIPEDAVFISGTWYFDGSLPDLGSARITLSFDNYGIFEIHAKTGYGSEIIMGYGGYYVKGNTVYTSVENTNNYEATMKITSNGDIIFGEISSNGDIIFGEKKFKKYRRR